MLDGFVFLVRCALTVGADNLQKAHASATQRATRRNVIIAQVQSGFLSSFSSKGTLRSWCRRWSSGCKATGKQHNSAMHVAADLSWCLSWLSVKCRCGHSQLYYHSLLKDSFLMRAKTQSTNQCCQSQGTTHIAQPRISTAKASFQFMLEDVYVLSQACTVKAKCQCTLETETLPCHP